MIGAVIGAGVAVLAVIAFAWWHAVQQRDSAKATQGALVGQEQLKSDLRAMTADRDAQKLRGDYQKARADALDLELDIVVDEGDPVRARGRVLSRLQAHEAATGSAPRGADAGAVSGSAPRPNPAVAGQLDDALAKPGD